MELIHQHLHELAPRLRTLNTDIPPELDDLVSRLLAKDPADRPHTREVSAALEEIADLCERAERAPQPGADVDTQPTLSWEEAEEGAAVPMRMTTRKACQDCAGTGTGADSPCLPCAGTGRRADVRTFKVRVPAGVRDGQRIRVRGFGAAGRNGGASWDILVKVHVQRAGSSWKDPAAVRLGQGTTAVRQLQQRPHELPLARAQREVGRLCHAFCGMRTRNMTGCKFIKL